MIRFECTCGRQLKAREENAGKVVLCPACKQRVRVPNQASTSIQPEEPSEPAPPPQQRVRPAPPDGNEMESETEDRPLDREAAGNSRKAIASLILGILALFCNVLAGLPALILAILALRDIGRSKGRLSGQGLAIAGLVSACLCTILSCGLIVPFAILLPAVARVRDAAARAQSSNNLKQMTLAMHSYHSTYHSLPASGVSNPNKPLQAPKPLLSWRVALLPFLNEKNLYQQFKHNEPWDSPHNIRLLSRMPKVYNCPAVQTATGETVYQVFVGNDAAFEKTTARRIPADFPDGTSNTILIVEAAHSVPWTKPEDLPFDPKKPIKPLLVRHRVGFLFGLADGSVHFVPSEISENTLRSAIIRNDGVPLGTDWPNR